ncbi:MAG: SDR family oxidoreductase [Ekhidna sp.]
MSKNILIIGATSDIAMATGRIFAKNGYSLTLAGRSIQRLEPFKKDTEVLYDLQVNLINFDVTALDHHDKLLEAISPNCEAVIYAAGYLGKEGDHSDGEIESIINANYSGAVLILEKIASKWYEESGKTIIGISSVAGDRGRMSNYLYGSAKAGFSAYLSGLRNRLYHSGTHVMTVKPGFVATKMTQHLDLPKPLTASPEKVAKVIYRGFRKKKNTIYVLGIWKWILLIIKLIPEGIFKRLKL